MIGLGSDKKSKDPLTLNLRPHLRYGMRLAAGCCWWLPQKDRRFESQQWRIWIIYPGLTDNDTQILVTFMDPYLMTGYIFKSSLLWVEGWVVLIWSKPPSLNFGGGFRSPRHGVLSGLRLSHLGVDLEETLKKRIIDTQTEGPHLSQQ